MTQCKKRYFFRLDDIAPEMDFEKFNRIKKIFYKYDIKPLVAVIPKNADPKIQYSKNREEFFWQLIQELKDNGWVIGQHGFRHQFETSEGGILNLHNRSEFAGLSFEIQNRKMQAGLEVLKSRGVEPQIFIAPAHSFDRVTLRVLSNNGINVVSDGFALYPFRKQGILWLPQITWRPRKFPLGLLTFALHHNTMIDSDFEDLESFIKANHCQVGNFNSLLFWLKEASMPMRLAVQVLNVLFKPLWEVAFWVKERHRRKQGYQDQSARYVNAEAYDQRSQTSILEAYVLGLWQPFLKDRIARISSSKVVVDWGCGSGEYALACKQAKKIYCVDISEPMLNKARQKLKDFDQAEFIGSSGFNDEIPAQTSDLVLTIGVWEYVDQAQLFNEVKRLTKKGSRVILVFPNIYNQLNFLRSLFHLKAKALRPGFVRKLFASDFNLIEKASFGMVYWCPKKIQFLFKPLWIFADLVWQPFQSFCPLGINVYYLFERK